MARHSSRADLVKQVFTNEDGSTGMVYLVTDDLDLTYNEMTRCIRLGQCCSFSPQTDDKCLSILIY